MIISKFNKYVEKHGRVIYIVLGIIIAFIFVIFATPDGAGSGCSGSNTSTVGKMFGKDIKSNEFQKLMRITDLAGVFRYQTFLSQLSEKYLREETLNRMRLLVKAKKEGFYRSVSKEDIATAIRDMVFFKDEKGAFDITKFTQFKDNFLNAYGFTAQDFDEMIRQDLAIQRLSENAVANCTVPEEELDTEMATFTVRRYTQNVDVEKDSLPNDVVIERLFREEKAQIPWKPQKAAIVAAIAVDVANTPITDAEIQKYFDSHKDNLYSGKTLDDVKESIQQMLKNQKARAKARIATGKLITDAKAEGNNTPEAFQKLAEAAGMTTFQTGLFPFGKEIPGFSQPTPQLTATIHALANVGQVSSTIFENNTMYVAMLSEIKPAEIPTQLTPDLYPTIIEYSFNQDSREWYSHFISIYGQDVEKTQSAWELASPQAQSLQTDPNIDDDRRQYELRRFSDHFRNNILPFYIPQKRAFTVVSFPIDDYVNPDLVTEADFQKGYDARKAQYQKTEVRLIMVQNKDEARAKEALAKIADGADIADIVKEYSEDENTKDKGGDTGFLDIETLVPAFRDELAKMELNQISPIVQAEGNFCFFKLLEKKLPRSLDDVREELKPILAREIARNLATQKATELSKTMKTAWTENEESIQSKGVFLKEKAGADAKVNDYPLLSMTSAVPQGPAKDYALMSGVFRLTQEQPFSDPISGTENIYVASLNELVPATFRTYDQQKGVSIELFKKTNANQKVSLKLDGDAWKMNKAIKDGATFEKATEKLPFLAESETINMAELREGKNTPDYVNTPYALILALKKTKEGQISEPIISDNKVSLIYVEKKDVAQDEEKRNQIRERLLNAKKVQALGIYLENLKKDSETETIWDDKE